MSRLSDHTFVSSAPVFGFDEDSYDPFYSADRAASPRRAHSAAAEASHSIPLESRAPDQIHERSR